MHTARIGHQSFPTDGGLMVVGGHATGFKLTVTAEQYKDGSWTEISCYYPHDGAFTVMRSSNRYMIGGGFSKDNGAGQTKETSAYNSLASGRLLRGVDLSVPRAKSKAINVGGKVRLVVWLKSGEKVVYELADAPVTTFSGSLLIIRSNKATATYERRQVQRYTYEDVVYSGIDLQPGERRVEVNHEGDEVTFRGLPAGATASVYNVGGQVIDQVKATDGQPLTISLRNRPNGVYIVKAGTETIKILKQ